MKEKKDEPKKTSQSNQKDSDMLKKSLERDLKENVDLSNKIQEITELLKRSHAEFINYRNRTEKENQDFFKYAGADIIRSLLPVIDSFEMALKNANDDIKKEIEPIYTQFIGTLNQLGLSEIETLGHKFDPYKHEVLIKEKSKEPEDTVIEILQKGYMYKDRILRHSKVKVSENN